MSDEGKTFDELRKFAHRKEAEREDRARVERVWKDAAREVKDVILGSTIGSYARPDVQIQNHPAVAEKDWRIFVYLGVPFTGPERPKADRVIEDLRDLNRRLGGEVSGKESRTGNYSRFRVTITCTVQGCPVQVTETVHP